ncbi:hypothetical protein B9G39_14020 [Zooshikella ganghwensis]|uniref:Uncharacterized protein n=1 Tax=Zooshikella ganghwensis TaxID=202772 RepID=A0A4P9VM92_9GAMM|nr:hypothetical protein B9G39_14020 [Zooshikella ganghwensis]
MVWCLLIATFFKLLSLTISTEECRVWVLNSYWLKKIFFLPFLEKNILLSDCPSRKSIFIFYFWPCFFVWGWLILFKHDFIKKNVKVTFRTVFGMLFYFIAALSYFWFVPNSFSGHYNSVFEKLVFEWEWVTVVFSNVFLFMLFIPMSFFCFVIRKKWY